MKTAIYITVRENQAMIQSVMEKFNITILQNFIGERDFYEFTQNDFKNFDSCQLLILDLQAIDQKTEKEKIISALQRIRLIYNTRIIIMALNYTVGSLLLHELVTKLQINDIITAQNSILFREELEKSVQEGLGFAHSNKYIINENKLLTVNKNTKVVKEIYSKIKQNITIGFVGSERRIGTTTQAINLTKFLSSQNVKATYIEFNNFPKVVKSIYKVHEGEKNITYYENINKLNYKGIEMYDSSTTNIADIITNEYEVYIYDYGAFSDITKEQEQNFFMCDIKFIVCGTKEWEEESLFKVFEKVKNIEENLNFIFNYTDLKDINKNLENMGKYKESTLFSEYIPDPFEIEKTNKNFFNKILNPYLLSSEIKPIQKKTIFNKILKRGNKNV